MPAPETLADRRSFGRGQAWPFGSSRFRSRRVVAPRGAAGLVPPALENKTIGVLAHQITVADKGHLDTGLTGTYFLTKYLMESGRNDLLFTIANQT